MKESSGRRLPTLSKWNSKVVKPSGVSVQRGWGFCWSSSNGEMNSLYRLTSAMGYGLSEERSKPNLEMSILFNSNFPPLYLSACSIILYIQSLHKKSPNPAQLKRIDQGALQQPELLVDWVGNLHPFLEVCSGLGGGDGEAFDEGDWVFVGGWGGWVDCVVEAVTGVWEDLEAGQLEVGLHRRFGD